MEKFKANETRKKNNNRSAFTDNMEIERGTEERKKIKQVEKQKNWHYRLAFVIAVAVAVVVAIAVATIKRRSDRV